MPEKFRLGFRRDDQFPEGPSISVRSR